MKSIFSIRRVIPPLEMPNVEVHRLTGYPRQDAVPRIAAPIVPVHLHHLYLDVLERSEAGGRLSDTGNCARRESVDRVHLPLALLQPPRDTLERSEAYCRTFRYTSKHGRSTRSETRMGGYTSRQPGFPLQICTWLFAKPTKAEKRQASTIISSHTYM